MNEQEAIQFITESSAPGSKPGLERITELLELCGSPQEKLKIIHVAGTNGKGSVCTMLASILRRAGYRIGVFTSPYLTKLNECIRCSGGTVRSGTAIDGGDTISGEELAGITEILVPLVEQMEDKPSEFELLTAAALLYFVKENCDAVILEAGMGGRQDATNVTDPSAVLLSVITNVAMDHTAFLGATIGEIAFQKAGVIKKGRPVIFGGMIPEAQAVISAQACDLKSPMVQTDYSNLTVKDSTLYGSSFDFGELTDLRITLSGLYQPYNAAIVLTAVSVLRENCFSIPEQAVREGLQTAVWPGRFEILSRSPLILYDGAHNEAGMTAAAESIRRYFGGQKVNLLTGVMRDKDYETMAELLNDLLAAVFAVTPANPRALEAGELADCYRRHGVEHSTSFPSIPDAVKAAVESSLHTGTPLIALGSLYMYQDVKAAVRTLAPQP